MVFLSKRKEKENEPQNFVFNFWFLLGMQLIKYE